MSEVEKVSTLDHAKFFLQINGALQIDISSFRDPTLNEDDIVFESQKGFSQPMSALSTNRSRTIWWSKGELIRVNQNDSEVLTKVIPNEDLYNAVINARKIKKNYLKS